MGRTTDLRRELKRRFHPLLRERGYLIDVGDGPGFQTFRSIVDGEVFVIDIQWEKYGRPRFVLNFGRSPAVDIVMNGSTLTPGQINTALCREHGRLQPGSVTTTRGWFRQDRAMLLRLLGAAPLPASVVVDELIRLFAELEAFWQTGVRSPHLHLSAPVRQWSAGGAAG